MIAKKKQKTTYPQFWDVPVSSLPEVGPGREKKLNSIGIKTVQDLLLYPPRRYEDRRCLRSIQTLEEGKKYTLSVVVEHTRQVYLRKGLSQARVIFKDNTGTIEGIFWGRPYLTRHLFQPGRRFFLYGSVERMNARFVMNNPEYEEYIDEETNIHTARIVPIYTLCEGISLRSFRRWVYETILSVHIEDDLSEEFLKVRGLIPMYEVFQKLHFPETLEEVEEARKRLAYNEVLKIQKEWWIWKEENVKNKSVCIHRTNGENLTTFRRQLPFNLTSAQQRVVDEILHDLSAPKQMLRLIQGDVGCGKTLVALHAVCACVDSCYQSALMAPTEILAEQHYLNLKKLFSPLPIRIELLTHSIKNAKEIRKQIAQGEIHIVVGTQALIQEATLFHNLGLVVIDEQHRFGVMQRRKLRMKGTAPDLLYLTATPIPRSLAMTIYGGMDISVIDEMPPGRSPVKTYIIMEKKREGLIQFIIQQAQKDFATYWVCPSIEESTHKENLKPLLAVYEKLRYGPFSSLRTDLIHGRLSFSEKADVINRFAQGEIDVLFSTTVIEVGIDVQRATNLVVENAECFGLAQLHQLRGRVGRGPHPSYCFLLPASNNETSMERLKILCATNDGFEIAEKDLIIRGHGEIGGLRQSGESDLKFINFTRDLNLIQKARKDAEILFGHPK
ncbi:MAG: ATP-dependent DNA helicase RecG [Candidatus Hydrogenedens sp.]